MNETYTIGDKVEITLESGWKVVGTVIRADYWGAKNGWYIQFAQDNGTPGYWKQGIDGGKIRKL